MNKIYKLKYDRRRNQVVAVSELTAGAGKESTGQVAALAGLTDMCSFRKLPGTLTPLAFLTGLVMSLLPGIALANPDLPTGGQIVAGQGSISTNGNQMTISQNTHGLVTNWNTFDVGQNHTVQFVQPDSSAVALNRVTGGHESQILGTLTANGQVMLVNPAGVMFGKGATVNTAGLVASTKNISNADFMAGHYTFSGGSDAGAEVVNQGNLTTTEGGFIVLAADRVKNSGNIHTPGGKTVLAAGDKVTLQLDNTGLASVSVSGSVVNALVENSGLLSATDGRVYLTARGKDMLLNTVVNNTGTVEASGLSGHGGEIVLNGGDSGVVSQSGTLLADSKTGHGGKITVEGQNIHMTANSRTSATGKTGGGEVYVGGGWQGKDSHIKNASQVVMSQGATIDVSATESGNGGRAVLWSDDYTNFRGDILARGGSRSGHGGQVETSSHGNLQAFGDVDASAVAGQGGNWLLDPVGINITPDSASDNVTTSVKGENNEEIFTSAINNSGKDVSKIKASTINNKLDAGTSVTIRTDSTGNPGRPDDGDINIFENIKKNGAGNATLTLDADRSIIFNKDKGISATGGSLNVNLYAARNSDGKVTLGSYTPNNQNKTGATTINTSGGDVMISRAPDAPAGHKLSVSITGGSKIEAKNIRLDATGGINVDGGTVLNASEKLNINAESGDITFTARKYQKNESGKDKTVDGPVMISGHESVTIQAKSGHLKMSAADKKQNGLTVSSDNGSVTLAGKVQDASDGLLLTNINITSKGNTDIEGLTHYGKAAVLSGVDINAGGNVTIQGTAYNSSKQKPGAVAGTEGVTLSGSHITSGGDVSLTGFSASKGNSSLQVIGKSDIKADSGKISLNGTTEGNNDKPGGIGGVRVDDSTLSAASLSVKGVAKKQGKGFSLTKTTLKGNIENLSNVTLSSAGSAAGVENALDNSIVNGGIINVLSSIHPENLTRIDMAGTAIFDDTGEAVKGWTADFTSEKTPNGGWVFNNTKLNASDTVNLKGAGFTNSTIHVTKGDLLLTNNSNLILNDDTVTVDNGGINAHSLNGNVNLQASSLSAKGDIKLKTDHGRVDITRGGGGTFKIISETGNIIVNANAEGKLADGISLGGASLIAKKGHITLDGVSDYFDYHNSGGGVSFSGVVLLDSMLNTITGKNTRKVPANNFGGVVLRSGSFTFQGKTDINAESNYAGLLYNPSGPGSNAELNFLDDATITASNKYGNKDFNYVGGMSIVQWYDEKHLIVFNTAKKLDIHSSAVYANGISSVWPNIEANNQGHYSGYIFKGTGDVSVTSESEFGAGIELRTLDNGGMTGSLSVKGVSKTQPGVIVTKSADLNVHDAHVYGYSEKNIGVQINADKDVRKVNLNRNVLEGHSESGAAGFQVKGKNVTITDGSVSGTVKSGPGAGVSFSGTGSFKVSGVAVKGESTEGTGVSAGNLEVNDSTIDGTGGKVGTKISGELTNTGKGKSSIHGSSSDGDGVQASGPVSLAGEFHVSGETDSGTAVNILAPLTTNEKTTIDGTATGAGTGVAVGPDVSVRKATINAFSRKGTGFKAGSGSTLDSVSVKGKTESGVGADIADLKDRTGGTTITGEATGHGTSVQTEHGNGSRPDIVPPAPGEDTPAVVPDNTPPAGHDDSVQDTAAVREYIREKQKQEVLSQPERLSDAVRVLPLKRNDPVVVDICQDGPCRKLNVGTVSEPVRL
ncbi:filamentous hemagglutinin N-terminal domain-containing protein [Salmonella enterica subsp. enterica serovar Hvittingfoss]|nr:filamentous hemagglutinin N-terminal domain-containing protein [Salmonella enterica subsp. enterica serovar Hvittingfoss]EHL2852764.1 filamentous hemagglutinin N-terminal domain-containing protein [Salmonella enterica subsp. enterica serovar Hvittingfoss]